MTGYVENHENAGRLLALSQNSARIDPSQSKKAPKQSHRERRNMRFDVRLESRTIGWRQAIKPKNARAQGDRVRK